VASLLQGPPCGTRASLPLHGYSRTSGLTTMAAERIAKNVAHQGQSFLLTQSTSYTLGWITQSDQQSQASQTPNLGGGVCVNWELRIASYKLRIASTKRVYAVGGAGLGWSVPLGLVRMQRRQIIKGRMKGEQQCVWTHDCNMVGPDSR